MEYLDRYLLLGQFSNPANPAIHRQTNGPEIWRDTQGDIDVFIAGVVTVGTLTGVSRYLKQNCGHRAVVSCGRTCEQPGTEPGFSVLAVKSQAARHSRHWCRFCSGQSGFEHGRCD